MLDETAKVFVALRELVEREPELMEFVHSARELERQAQGLVQGKVNVPKLPLLSSRRVSNRRLAELIIAVTSRLPPTDSRLSAAEVLGLGRLLENLVVGITGSILAQYPELLRPPERGDE